MDVHRCPHCGRPIRPYGECSRCASKFAERREGGDVRATRGARRDLSHLRRTTLLLATIEWVFSGFLLVLGGIGFGAGDNWRLIIHGVVGVILGTFLWWRSLWAIRIAWFMSVVQVWLGIVTHGMGGGVLSILYFLVLSDCLRRAQRLRAAGIDLRTEPAELLA